MSQTHVETNVPLVKLVMFLLVSLVLPIDLDHHLVVVMLVIMKPMIHAPYVHITVLNVIPSVIVPFVLETELDPHTVTVHPTLMIPKKPSVHLAQMLVNLVIYLEPVPFVQPTETHSQTVLVNHITLKPSSKDQISVKFVMLDVLNVLEFSITVLLVLLIHQEMAPQDVIAQLVISTLVVKITILMEITPMLKTPQETDATQEFVKFVNLNV